MSEAHDAVYIQQLEEIIWRLVDPCQCTQDEERIVAAISKRLGAMPPPKVINAAYFKNATGFEPEQDDLERCNCDQTGEPGHWMCGWCAEHDLPKFQCGCPFKMSHWSDK